MNPRPVQKFKLNKNEFMHNFITKETNKEYIAPYNWDKGKHPTFQQMMRFTILLGQCFGVNPVLGVCENDPSKLRFTYYSGRSVYSVMIIAGQVAIVSFSVIEMFNNTNDSLFSNSAGVFFVENFISTILFFKVAGKWPRLSRQIAKMEAIDPNTDNTLIIKCNVTCIVIFVTAVVEHALSDLSSVTGCNACNPELDCYDSTLRNNFYWVWRFVPYNLFSAALTKFIVIQCTFIWAYSNTFIICICWFLLARFRQVNDRINAVRGQCVPSSFWRTMREDYTKTTELVRSVDEVVSGIIFVAFAANLFSICFLILHILELSVGLVNATYLIFAIVLLMLRSLAMCLIASRVHSASVQPAYALYDVPSNAYCIEVQRFLDQVHGDIVHLTGSQFFGIRRSMVLTIAATIVTYELVLLQFSEVSPTAATAIMKPSNETA